MRGFFGSKHFLIEEHDVIEFFSNNILVVYAVLIVTAFFGLIHIKNKYLAWYRGDNLAVGSFTQNILKLLANKELVDMPNGDKYGLPGHFHIYEQTDYCGKIVDNAICFDIVHINIFKRRVSIEGLITYVNKKEISLIAKSLEEVIDKRKELLIRQAERKIKIKVLAHAKWEAAGKPDGNSLGFWKEAEKEITLRKQNS